MERFTEKNILSALENGSLYLYGLPGCGKTTVCQHVLKTLHRDFISFDCNVDSSLRKLFEKSDYNDLTEIIASEAGVNPGQLTDSLVVIDSLEALKKDALCYLLNRVPERNFLLVGVLPLSMIGENSISEIRLRPFSFTEWLFFMEHEEYAEMLRARSAFGKEVPGFFRPEILEAFENFLLTGGFPEICRKAREERFDISAVAAFEKHYFIALLSEMTDYGAAFGLISREKLRKLLELAGEALPEYRKVLTFSHIRKGICAADFKKELDFLREAGIAFPVSLGAGIRLEMTDVGMSRFLAGDYRLFLETEELREFPVSPLQNFLYTELLSPGEKAGTWQSERTAFVNLVMEKEKKAYLCAGGKHMKSGSIFRKQMENYELWNVGFEFTTENDDKDSKHNISYPEIAKTQF